LGFSYHTIRPLVLPLVAIPSARLDADDLTTPPFFINLFAIGTPKIIFLNDCVLWSGGAIGIVLIGRRLPTSALYDVMAFDISGGTGFFCGISPVPGTIGIGVICCGGFPTG
jgi:hypothetical protein